MIWRMMSDGGDLVNPVAELHRLNQEVNQLFGWPDRSRAGVPALNVWTMEDRVMVLGAVPGLEAKDLTLTVEGRSLLIEGERTPEQAASPNRRERTLGRFRREVQLPFEVAAEHVTAKCERGLVTITLPRSEQSKPRKIAVTTG